MKEGLEYSKDFLIVNEEIWKWIGKYIGGGPDIKLYVLDECPFQTSLVKNSQEPNLLATKAVYSNDLKVTLINKSSSTNTPLQLPSILSSNDLLSIVKTELSRSSFKLYLDNCQVNKSTNFHTLTENSLIEYEEIVAENEKECQKTDSTGICTPLFSDKPEMES